MAATTAPEPPIDRVVLQANSYDFGAMHKAAEKAEGLKKPEDRRAAYAEMASKMALNQDVIEGREGIALPEGTALVNTTDAQGREVVAAVTFADPDQLAKALATMPAPPEPAAQTDTAAASGSTPTAE